MQAESLVVRQSKTCAQIRAIRAGCSRKSNSTNFPVSIRERGIIQPIVVRALQGDNFEIIAGERRWRAAQRAGLHDVPIAIIEANDAQSLEFAIIENVQRADLNPIEEASGYLALMDDFNRTQDEVAQIVGKSRPHVANTIRSAQAIRASETAGPFRQNFSRSRTSFARSAQCRADRAEIIDKGLSVRQLEARTCAKRTRRKRLRRGTRNEGIRGHQRSRHARP